MPTSTIPQPLAVGRKRSKPSIPLRICHISMTLQTGGLERLLVDFARFHNHEQFHLQFVSLTELGAPAEDLRRLGFAAGSLHLDQIGKLRGLRNLRDMLRRERIDIVHTHNTYAHFYGTLAARAARVPIVVNTQHGRGCGKGWKARCQFFLANRLAKRVVGVSEDAAKLCRGEDPFSTRKTMCIWNGIDLQRFAFTGPANEMTAISVARLSPEKDYGTLLRAIPQVLKEFPEFRLKLVGNGAERERLEALSLELKLNTHVDFLGECSDVPQQLKQAGFFVSSSKTEGISLTLLEAMAVGLPVLTTRVGGNPEIVVEGETGRLVPAQNVDAMGNALVQMCRDRGQWEMLGRNGRDRVERNFDVRRMVGKYEELYHQLAGK